MLQNRADVIMGKTHIVKAYADKHSLTAAAITDSADESDLIKKCYHRGTSQLFEYNAMGSLSSSIPCQVVEQAMAMCKKRLQEARAQGAETHLRRHSIVWNIMEA